MRRHTKAKIIILIILGILFTLLPIITINHSFITGNNDKSSDYSDVINLDNKNLRISAVSEKIHIIGNSGWEDFKNDGNCMGSGSYSDPYIIEDLEIDGRGSGSCILIESSDVYFKIENCSLYNSGEAGIRLENVENSQLIHNNCSYNEVGIDLYQSDHNIISGNTANHNHYGIRIYGLSYYNEITENTANDNWTGILIVGSNRNTVSGSTTNNNDGTGIGLFSSNHNTISGNTANYNSLGIGLIDSAWNNVSRNILIGNGECIGEENCEGNIFENNDCGGGEGFELVILISVISGGAVIGVATLLLIIRKRKRIQ